MGPAQPMGAAQPPASGQPPYPGAPGGYAGGPGAPPPHQAGPAPAGKPWFARWWTIVVLVGLLLLGAAGGYGGTRVTMDFAAEESEASGTSGPVATASESPVPTDPADSLLPPSDPPVEPPDELSTVCGEVAVIFLQVSSAGMEEIDDIDDYLDGVVDARRTAADDLRDLDTDDPQERSSLDTFADELDESAQMADDNRRDVDTIEESFERAVDAYFAFNDEHC